VSVTFVSAAIDKRAFATKIGTRRQLIAVRNTRGLTRDDLHLNRATAAVEVDPVSGAVSLDGQPLSVEPQSELPLNRSHFLA
jgi:urease subunit alpha